MEKIQVLIVEDDPMVMEIHRNYIMSVKDFCVIATAYDGREALDIIKKNVPDLVILDIFMPRQDGIRTLHKIRKQKSDIDVIVVTASREPETVEKIMRFGAFDYIIKPFSFERLNSALESYKKYKDRLMEKEQNLTQEDIDGLISRNRYSKTVSSLPKGLNCESMNKIMKVLENSDTGMSTDEVATEAGFSRVTAWRYLEFLLSSDSVIVHYVPHPNAGRPTKKYSLI